MGKSASLPQNAVNQQYSSACMTTVVRKLCDADHEAKLKFVHLVPSGGVCFWRNPPNTGSVE